MADIARTDALRHMEASVEHYIFCATAPDKGDLGEATQTELK